jgi:hypothetical protein
MFKVTYTHIEEKNKEKQKNYSKKFTVVVTYRREQSNFGGVYSMN